MQTPSFCATFCSQKTLCSSKSGFTVTVLHAAGQSDTPCHLGARKVLSGANSISSSASRQPLPTVNKALLCSSFEQLLNYLGQIHPKQITP